MLQFPTDTAAASTSHVTETIQRGAVMMASAAIMGIKSRAPASVLGERHWKLL